MESNGLSLDSGHPLHSAFTWRRRMPLLAQLRARPARKKHQQRGSDNQDSVCSEARKLSQIEPLAFTFLADVSLLRSLG